MKIFIITLIISSLIMACNNTPKKEKRKITKKEYKETLESVNRYMVKLDAERINSFAKRRGWKMQQSQTGLWYMIYDETNDEKASIGKIATLKYKISLLDGTLCYSSDSLGTKTFLIGRGGVESGLEEGILLMKKGEKARFIMPPHKAHGILGDMNKIRGRQTILYEIELVELTK